MNAQSTTKVYTKILDGMLAEMADIYGIGKESGQCEIALKEQIRTSFMSMFKMDLLQATTCTEKVIEKYNMPESTCFRISGQSYPKATKLRAIQRALAS